MKNWKAILAISVFLVVFSQLIWTSAQFSMPMSCSDEKESCIWYEQGIVAETAPLVAILPAILVISFLLIRELTVMNLQPIRISKKAYRSQRTLVKRE